jgi:hypothetical protein
LWRIVAFDSSTDLALYILAILAAAGALQTFY